MRKFIATMTDYLNENKNEDNVNDIIWYHGSKEKFDKFKLKKGTLYNLNHTSPIFLTSNLDFATNYAGNYSPYIYKVKVLTDNIMDFRKLPNVVDIKESDEVANSLLDFIYDNFENNKYNFYWAYPERCYQYLLSGEYSEVERLWVLDWLKINGYDGSYLIETDVLNLLIFDETKIEIVSVEKI